MWRKILLFALIVAILCSVSIISILTMGYVANAEDLIKVKLYEKPERYEYTQAIGVSLHLVGGRRIVVVMSSRVEVDGHP